ncbi:MAG: trigger factor [Clostridiaceae bacterium]|nr:trigger factor [Clostridiaceae bacterium]
MAAQMEQLENSMVKVTVDVAKEDFQDAMQKAFNKNKRRFTIPGFRKGKAPMKMVTNYYGESILYDDAIDIAAQPAYENALEELSVEPFSQPQFEILEIGYDKGMGLAFTFAVKPEVKLGNYKGVTAYRPDDSVAPEDIEREIERAREQVSRLVPIEDRPVQEDDTVTIDYSGSKDGVEFEGGTAEDYDLVIGSNTFIPGFEEKLIGHEIGEQFDIDLTFPEDYHAEDLAGQDVVFNVKIKEIKFREIPELDDDFVKDVSEDADTVEEYKESIRSRLAEEKEKHADETLMNNAIKIVVQNAEMDLPHVVIHEEMERMYNDQARQMEMQGFNMDQYMEMLGLDKQTMMMQLHNPAEEKVKTGLVLDAIVEAEKIEVTDEDRDEQIQKYADMYQMEFDNLKKTFEADGALEMLNSDLTRQKAMDLIKEHAIATDVEPEPEEHDHDHDHDHDHHHDHDHASEDTDHAHEEE